MHDGAASQPVSPDGFTDPAVKGRTPDEMFEDIVATYKRAHPRGGTSNLYSAYKIANAQHAGQTRATGDPYIVHPLAVTEILADYGLDEASLAAALMHDTVEDTDLTLMAVRDEFGDEIALLIDGVTKLDKIKFWKKNEIVVPQSPVGLNTPDQTDSGSDT